MKQVLESYKYWKEREHENAQNMIRDEKLTQMRLQAEYNRAREEIEQRIQVFYERYATSQRISIEEALKRVSQLDVKAFEKKAKEYVANLDFSEEANRELKLYNATMRINRFEMLKAEINLELSKSTHKVDGIIGKHLERTAIKEYARQAGILGTDIKTSKSAVSAIVHGSYKYGNFSKNLWTNHEKLNNEIGTMLRRSIIQGANPTTMIGRFREQFTVGASDAKRLLVTEASRVAGDVQIDCMEQAGYERYVYIAEPNACKICSKLDGRDFAISEREIGKNYYPMHPYCKCSSAAYASRDKLEKMLAKYELEDGTERNNNINVLKKHNTIKNSEEIITKSLKNIVNKSNGKLAGLEFRLKTLDSLKRKIKTDSLNEKISEKDALEKVNDILRYTTIFNETKFVNNYFIMKELLKTEGYSIIKVKNTWVNGMVYKGINTILEKDGIKFEMQYHTEESFNLKNGKLHELYENARLDTTTYDEKLKLKNEMIKLSNSLKNPKKIERVR